MSNTSGTPSSGTPPNVTLPNMEDVQAAVGDAAAQDLDAITIARIHYLMESCSMRLVMSGVMGMGFGAFMGLAFGALDPTLEHHGTGMQGTKAYFRATGRRMWSMGKNFGAVGMLFAGTECTIEKARGTHDMYNSAMAGAISGAALSSRGGTRATLIGAGGFAAFSVAIDHFMRM